MSGRPSYSLKALDKLRTAFKKADLLVFLESKNNPNISEPCLDEVFWTKIYSIYKPSKRIAFRPSGGKSQLESIIEEFKKNGPLEGIYIARDRDFDFLRTSRNTLKKMHVLTTYGYSWENDLFINKKIIERIYRNLGVTSSISIDQSNLYGEIKKKLKRITQMDFAFYHKGTTLIPRKSGYGRIIKGSSVIGYKICIMEASKLYKDRKNLCNDKDTPIFPRKINPIRDCYGKLILYFISCWISATYKRLTGDTLSLGGMSFSRMAIQAFAQELPNHKKSPLYKHYQTLLN